MLILHYLSQICGTMSHIFALLTIRWQFKVNLSQLFNVLFSMCRWLGVCCAQSLIRLTNAMYAIILITFSAKPSVSDWPKPVHPLLIFTNQWQLPISNTPIAQAQTTYGMKAVKSRG